ncbi:MAG: helix-turn-helix transcriptional regulator [Tissierellia bacterium]|nr:helix-turn-helix transcriptional regulator [Tissierellia bacterium]
MDAKKIGRRLKMLRGKTPGREVCKAVGISRSTLSMYEQGQRIPRDAIKGKLADYYKKSVQELFYD